MGGTVLSDHSGEPFDDVRVRQAVKHAVDKEEILASAINGQGVLAQDNQISPAHKYYADLPQTFGPGAQPDQARELLSEAGYDDGIDLDYPLVVAAEEAPPMEPTAVLIQEHLSEIGIEFDIQTVTWSTFLSEYSRRHPLYVTSYGMLGDPLFLLLHSNGPYNETGFSSDELDQAIYSAWAADSEEEAQEHMTTAQRVVQEEAGYLIWGFPDAMMAKANYVNNVGMDPMRMEVPLNNAHLGEGAPTGPE
jgi:peptide/nickel transport system substrate-binding protein